MRAREDYKLSVVNECQYETTSLFGDFCYLSKDSPSLISDAEPVLKEIQLLPS